jgi:L-ascorbate metabolism protein UlaG (beta-lactamase superfamily)
MTLGLKRFVAPALRVRQLPKIDFILLTHAHGSFRHRHAAQAPRDSSSSPRRPRAICCGACGSARSSSSGGARDGVRARAQARRDRSLRRPPLGRAYAQGRPPRFNGYLLERRGHRISIAGDTARTSFRHVGHREPIDVIAVPIGAYNPWIGSHCTPEQAVEMANEARARFVVPIHHQTFRLGREPMGEPIRRFTAAIDPRRIALTDIGETFTLPA